jgi:predicted nuclease with TOPRIM domain
MAQIVKEITNDYDRQNNRRQFLFMSRGQGKTNAIIEKLIKENRELKSKLEMYENGAIYSSNVDELQEETSKLTKQWLKSKEEKRELQDRIDKVINYIEDGFLENCTVPIYDVKHGLENILQILKENK